MGGAHTQLPWLQKGRWSDCRWGRARGGDSQQRHHLLLVFFLNLFNVYLHLTASFLLTRFALCYNSSTTLCNWNPGGLCWHRNTPQLEEVGGMLCAGGLQRPPVVCLHVACAVCACVSTLELVDFRALRVHVRVIQRVARGVAVWRRQAQRCAGSRRVRVVLERVRAGVETQIREFGGWLASFGDVLIVKVLQVHEPLGPESSTDTLAVQGQIDELAWGWQRGEWAWCWRKIKIITLQKNHDLSSKNVKYYVLDAPDLRKHPFVVYDRFQQYGQNGNNLGFLKVDFKSKLIEQNLINH